MAQRAKNPITVLGPDGRPLAGASVYTRNAITGLDATVYAGRTGAGAGANPATSDAQGRVVQWVERGAYASTVTATGMTPWIEDWDATPGADGALDPAWVPDDLVVTRMVAADAIGSGELASGAADWGALGADVLSAIVPIGGLIAGPWTSLPAGGRFGWADGGLIDKTTYAAFFAAFGHVYNGGVDPGGNTVRKADKRGRVIVGADNMGSGAAGRLPNSNRALGQNGGEERHAQTSAELAVHAHALTLTTFQPRADSGNAGVGASAQYVAGSNGFTGLGSATPYGYGMTNTGSATPFNVLQPYEIEAVIQRIAL